METREDRMRRRDAEIDAMIDRYRMEQRCGMTRQEIRDTVLRCMVLNNLAFVLADVADTFLMDCESGLSRFGVAFGQRDKYNFRQMMTHLRAARKWASECALPLYGQEESDDACAESDWWHSLAMLIDDRIGDDPVKTRQFLEWLLAMPSQTGLFNITYDDFKQFKY